MKQIRSLSILMTLAAAVTLVSCHDDLAPEVVSGETRVLSVRYPAPPPGESRTALNNLTPVWSAGDAVWVSDGTNAVKAVVSDEFAGMAEAYLTVTGLNENAALYLLYPYDEGAKVASGNITARVPVVQDGEFRTAHLAVGLCEAASNSVVLNNATALMRFSVSREDVWTLQLSHPNLGITGDYKFAAATGDKKSNVSAVRKLRMDFNSRTGEFFIATLGVNYPANTSFTFISREGRMGSITTSAANSLSAGTLYELGNLDDMIEFDESPAVTLGVGETANCYVVSEPGAYRFRTVKGNSGTSVGEVAYADLVWETVNTTSGPTKYSIIKEVAYSEGYLYFRIPEGAPDGNALVSACDEAGNVLWSWHIWVLSEGFEDQTYSEGSPDAYSGAVMMDRNLGALTAEPGLATTHGFFYQWGRKDPFPGIGVLSGTTKVGVTGTAITTVSQTASNGTLEYATANPTKVIYKSSSDWLVNSNPQLWSASAKTIYDPCPAGYHVPYENAIEGLTVETAAWNATSKGRGVTIGSQSVWYPAAGDRNSSGSLANGGTNGYYWYDDNTSTSGMNSWFLSSSAMGIYDKAQAKSCSFSVRCQKYVATGDEQTLSIALSAEANQSFATPILTGAAYSSARVFWGDGDVENLAMQTARTHTYVEAGDYTMTVKGYSLTNFKIKSVGDITSINVSGF